MQIDHQSQAPNEEDSDSEEVTLLAPPPEIKLRVKDRVKIKNVIDRRVIGKGEVVGICGCPNIGQFHGMKIPKNYIKISVVDVYDDEVCLPIPSYNDEPTHLTLGDALGGMALWNHKHLTKY